MAGLDNVLVVADGRKEVVLFSPWQLPDLYPHMEAHRRWQSAARSTLYLRDGDDFPRLQAAPRLMAVLQAGDALWIPAGWWHEVLTPTTSVAFNFWFKPHACARLRPTMLHLHSDHYAATFGPRVGDHVEADNTPIVPQATSTRITCGLGSCTFTEGTSRHGMAGVSMAISTAMAMDTSVAQGTTEAAKESTHEQSSSHATGSTAVKRMRTNPTGHSDHEINNQWTLRRDGVGDV